MTSDDGHSLEGQPTFTYAPPAAAAVVLAGAAGFFLLRRRTGR